MNKPAKPESVQVLLVSDQPTPNLTPAIDPRTRPDEVVLVVSHGKTEQAGWLEDTLKPRGIRVSRWAIDDPWDIVQVRERMLALAVEYDGSELVLNATGGTKPMSIAAYEVFRDLGLPIFYVHPANDHLVWMYPWERSGFDLADRLKLPAFLQAHGAQIDGDIERSGIPAQLRELGEGLVRDVQRLEQPLATLNWLASRAEGSLTVTLERRQLGDRKLEGLLQRFVDAGAARLDGAELRFADEAARFFANGGWLEEYVFGVIQGLRGELKQIQDLARGVEVTRGGGQRPVRNELDVVFLADNRLYVIECKTRRFKSDGADGPGAETLYKLDTLAPLLGGLGARAMLVSFQPLSDPDRRRAKELAIRSCVGGELHGLADRLRRWVNGY
jgi:hypothetical protein